MNAVVAIHIEPLTVVFEPTITRPLILRVEHRADRGTDVFMMHPQTCEIIVAASSYEPSRSYIRMRGDQLILQVGDARFYVTQAEAERLRDELQLPLKLSAELALAKVQP